jgi:spore germination protein YaaH
VVAYLPYWVGETLDTQADRYLAGGRLTDVVLFSVGVRRDGSLRLDSPGARFVLGDSATRIIEAAHTRGVRVLASFTSFNLKANRILFREQAAMDRFVEEASALVRLRGLDGADLDVEHIHKRRFADYAWTAGQLRASLLRDNPLARVTVATNGNRSGAMMAAAALDAGADRAFLVGYAYRGPTSQQVGSIAPIASEQGLDLRESFGMYRAHGVDLGRVIVGLPAYGMTWATVGPELRTARAPTTVSERGQTTLFRDVTEAVPPGTIHDTDPEEGSARATWFDRRRGSWFQTYYDTPETLRAKYLLAHELDLAGIGMWALGYDGSLPGYPELVEQVFNLPVVDIEGEPAQVSRDRNVTIAVRIYDGYEATEAIRLSNDGSIWGAWRPATASVRTLVWKLALGADGPRAVHVQSRSGDGTLSTVQTASTILDTQAPVIDGIGLRQVSAGAWMLSFHARDLTGLVGLDVRWRVGDRPWGRWQPLDSLASGSVLAPADTQVHAELRLSDPAGHRSTWLVSSASG